MLPFTKQQFFDVFIAHGGAIWPLQILAYALAVIALVIVFTRPRWNHSFITIVLAAMWLATGLLYHMAFFAAINNAAYLFGALFVIQGLAFAYVATVRSTLEFGFSNDFSGWAGLLLAIYAIVAYFVIGILLGHPAIGVPAFGFTPCPVTLFTFGMLLLTTSRVPSWLLAIPVLWSIIGGTAAFLLGVPQDWVLLFSGIGSVAILRFRSR